MAGVDKRGSTRNTSQQDVVLGLLLIGVIARLVPHPWNVTPVTAIALFGGACLTKRGSLLLPSMP